MKRPMPWCAVLALLSATPAAAGAADDAATAALLQSAAALAPAGPITEYFMIRRLYAGADGQSHLDDIALPRTAAVPGQSVQSRLFATDVELGDAMPGYFVDWHGVSSPRLLIVLSGQLEIGLGDGSKHILKKGDMVLAADTSGRGHTSRGVGTEVIRVLTVRLPVTDSLAPKYNACPPGLPAGRCVATSLDAAAAKPAPPKP